MNKLNSSKHHRRSIRLKGRDYSSCDSYFITICVQERQCLLGDAKNCTLNDAGQMVSNIWEAMPLHHAGIEMDAFVVMPNHFHAIAIFGERVRAAHRGRPFPCGNVSEITLPALINRFKTLTTKRYIDAVKADNWPAFRKRLWQRNYYEHIIRNDIEFSKIQQYIEDNPERWQEEEGKII